MPVTSLMSLRVHPSSATFEDNRTGQFGVTGHESRLKTTWTDDLLVGEGGELRVRPGVSSDLVSGHVLHSENIRLTEREK